MAATTRKKATATKRKTPVKRKKPAAVKASSTKRAAAKPKTAAKRKAPARKAAPQKADFNKQPVQIMEKVMTQGKTQYDKLAQDSAKAGQEQFEAVVQSTNVAMKGFEDIYKTCFSLLQSTADKNSKAVKTLLGCKTLNELTETQNKLLQQNFDDFMSGATKISEISVKVCTDCLEPVNQQLTKNIKKATESVAA